MDAKVAIRPVFDPPIVMDRELLAAMDEEARKSLVSECRRNHPEQVPELVVVREIVDRLEAAFARNDFDDAKRIFSSLEYWLVDFKGLPPSFEDTRYCRHELFLGRQIYEAAIVLSVMIKDQDAFETALSKLKPYYTHECARFRLLFRSEPEFAILRFNLLRLLLQNKFAEFHSELEFLSNTAEHTPRIMGPIGSEPETYHKMFTASQIADFLLSETDRDGISACGMGAHIISSAMSADQKLLLFHAEQKLVEYINEYAPRWTMKNGRVVSIEEDESHYMKNGRAFWKQEHECCVCKEMLLINQTLDYVTDLNQSAILDDWMY